MGTQLGIILAKLERHAESTSTLIDAAVIYRTDEGKWDIDDMQWLHRERSVLGETPFSRIIGMRVPPIMQKEINAAIQAAKDPEEQ